MKNLVVYYSHSGNTRKCADMIKNLLNADIVELKPRVPYKTGMWDCVDEFKHEIKNNLRRDIEAYDIDVKQYDNVFIGTPNWGDTVATPLLSFFDVEDLTEKKIMPFVTHGGGGLGNCEKDIIKYSRSKFFGKAFVYTGSSVKEAQVEKWLKNESIL